MLPLWQALVLGATEGLTEFLPISSTAHLILTTHLLNIAQTEFIKSFEIIIQLGAILAVVGLFWKKFLDIEILKKIAVAFLPTGIIGLTVYKILKEHLLGNLNIVLWSLLIGGIILILYERTRQQASEEELQLDKITYSQAFTIGVFQAIAIIPGVSRAGATIIGGSMLGINRRTIVEFSFLLAAPTMLAATVLDLFKNYQSFSSSESAFLAVGFITSAITAAVAVKFLLNFIKRKDFQSFGIYRIILAALFFFFII